MGRRGLMAGAVAAAVLLLGGCTARSLQARVNRAAEGVEGVESSQLEVDTGGTMVRRIRGEIRCAVGGAALEPVFDRAWAAVITLLHEAGEDSRQIEIVHGIGEDGTVLGAAEWIPEAERNVVLVADFYERYGLR